MKLLDEFIKRCPEMKEKIRVEKRLVIV